MPERVAIRLREDYSRVVYSFTDASQYTTLLIQAASAQPYHTCSTCWSCIIRLSPFPSSHLAHLGELEGDILALVLQPAPLKLPKSPPSNGR